MGFSLEYTGILCSTWGQLAEHESRNNWLNFILNLHFGFKHESDECPGFDKCWHFLLRNKKILELELKSTEKFAAIDGLISLFFSENKEGIKLVYLVRDPRAVMNSRKNYEWCMTSENCMNPRNLCKDMVDDFKEAKRLLKNKNSTLNIK